MDIYPLFIKVNNKYEDFYSQFQAQHLGIPHQQQIWWKIICPCITQFSTQWVRFSTDFNNKHSHCYERWVGPNYQLLFQVPVDVCVLRLHGWTARICPPFWVRPNSGSKFPDYIWALTYVAHHSHSMNMFNRSFDQFRFHWSCSLCFNNFKQVQDHRPGVHSLRYFLTTHSVSYHLDQICSLLQMLWPSITHCYEEIIEDTSLLYWFPQEEYSSTQKLPCLGTFQFRIVLEGFFIYLSSPNWRA